MTSFQLPINARDRNAGRFIARVHAELQQAMSEERAENGLTQQALANRIGIDRSAINRYLQGKSNLTLRTVADIAWALNRRLVFELKELKEDGNFLVTFSSEPPDEITSERDVDDSLSSEYEIEYHDGDMPLETKSIGFMLMETTNDA